MRMIATIKRVNVNTLETEEVMFSCLSLDSLLREVMFHIKSHPSDGFTHWTLVKAILDEGE